VESFAEIRRRESDREWPKRLRNRPLRQIALVQLADRVVVIPNRD